MPEAAHLLGFGHNSSCLHCSFLHAPGAHHGLLLNAHLERVKIDVFNHFSLFHLGFCCAHAGDTVNVTPEQPVPPELPCTLHDSRCLCRSYRKTSSGQLQKNVPVGDIYCGLHNTNFPFYTQIFSPTIFFPLKIAVDALIIFLIMT